MHTFLWCKVARGGGGVFTTAQPWGVPAAGPKTPRSGAQTLGCSWIVTGTCTGSGPQEGTTWQGASDPAPSQPSASFPLSSGIWAALVSISPLRPWARFGGGGGGPSAIGLHWHKPNPGTRVTDKLPGRERDKLLGDGRSLPALRARAPSMQPAQILLCSGPAGGCWGRSKHHYSWPKPSVSSMAYSSFSFSCS